MPPLKLLTESENGLQKRFSEGELVHVDEGGARLLSENDEFAPSLDENNAQLSALACSVQSGNADAIPRLWERVERFVAWSARRYYKKFPAPLFELDELTNSGFIAMLEACKKFNPDAGSFLSILAFTLKTSFAEVTGFRLPRQRHDASSIAASLETPLEGSELTLLDTVSERDSTKPHSIYAVEQRIWNEQLRESLDKALEKLPRGERNAIRLRYFFGLSYKKQAECLGTSKQSKAQLAQDGIWRIRGDSRTMRELSSFLYGEVYFDEAKCLRKWSSNDEL